MGGPQKKGRLAIISGGGKLPQYVAEAAVAAGEDPLILAISGECSINAVDGCEVSEISIGDVVQIERQMDRANVDRVILSGSIQRRPAWREIRPTFATIAKIPSILKALTTGGDDTVLRMVIGLIEKNGRRVIGAQEVVPSLVAELGPLNAVVLDKYALGNIDVATKAARMLGALDIGQGAVAVGGRVVALEGPEGTDAMLRRVAEMRKDGRISARHPGVLVKLCKINQDMRADLPSIGPSTIENAKAAGLNGIAIEAGRSFVLDREESTRLADASGLFLYGLAPDDEGA